MDRKEKDMEIKIKRIENGKLPEYKTEGSVGADCYARLKKEVVIKAGKSETIPLGFAVEIPVGYEMQIRGRSGLARKNNIDCFTGTIDFDYRGEVCAILLNKGEEDFKVNPFDRIAQAVIAPVIKAEWHLTEKLSETERGENGFGSTGIKEPEKKSEKFYEPFRRIRDITPLIGKDVIVDGSKKGRVSDVGLNNDFVIIKFQILRDNLQSADTLNLFSAQAFDRVEIDGHRFGKEIEFE